MLTIKKIEKEFRNNFPFDKIGFYPIPNPEDIKSFYRQQILTLLKEIEGEIKGYREDDKKGGWEKGKYGNRVKWYGQGFNHASSLVKTTLERIINLIEK